MHLITHWRFMIPQFSQSCASNRNSRQTNTRRQQALSLLSEMQDAGVTRNVISFSASISACEKGGQWQQALSVLSEMQDAGVTRDVISYNAVISACEKGCQWQQALWLINEMQDV